MIAVIEQVTVAILRDWKTVYLQRDLTQPAMCYVVFVAPSPKL